MDTAGLTALLCSQSSVSPTSSATEKSLRPGYGSERLMLLYVVAEDLMLSCMEAKSRPLPQNEATGT